LLPILFPNGTKRVPLHLVSTGIRVVLTLVPGSWQFSTHDQFSAGDFNGDGKADLSLFDGSTWSIASLGLLQSNGSGLPMATRSAGTVPGWQMRTNETHSFAALNGDGKADLFVYNDQDWSTHYLGRMISEGTSMAADWVADWVGGGNLEAVDQLAPCDARGCQWPA
jgi:hypothetical protein